MITIRHVVCDRESYFVKDTATAMDDKRKKHC